MKGRAANNVAELQAATVAVEVASGAGTVLPFSQSINVFMWKTVATCN